MYTANGLELNFIGPIGVAPASCQCSQSWQDACATKKVHFLAVRSIVVHYRALFRRLSLGGTKGTHDK